MDNVKRFPEDSAYITLPLPSPLSSHLTQTKYQKYSCEPSQEACARATIEGNFKSDGPHRYLLQTHHHRQQQEGNSHAAYVFRGGAVQVWHGYVEEGSMYDDDGSGVVV